MILGTWSWDDTLAGNEPALYRSLLRQALSVWMAPGDGVQLVVLLQFPPVGPNPLIASALGRQRRWTLQTEEQASWDRAAKAMTSAFPGHVVYLPTAQVFAPGGVFLTWAEHGSTASGSESDRSTTRTCAPTAPPRWANWSPTTLSRSSGSRLRPQGGSSAAGRTICATAWLRATSSAPMTSPSLDTAACGFQRHRRTEEMAPAAGGRRRLRRRSGPAVVPLRAHPDPTVPSAGLTALDRLGQAVPSRAVRPEHLLPRSGPRHPRSGPPVPRPRRKNRRRRRRRSRILHKVHYGRLVPAASSSSPRPRSSFPFAPPTPPAPPKPSATASPSRPGEARRGRPWPGTATGSPSPTASPTSPSRPTCSSTWPTPGCSSPR